jgi:YD repeat-containing protein
MTSFDGPWGMGSFGYDSLGNRRLKKIATVNTDYQYLSNRLISTTGGEPFSFGYNSDGDLTYLKNTLAMEYSLKYDRFHNLLSYDHNAGPIATFTYDGDGMRLTKTSGNKTMIYHYDKEGKVISEGDEFGNFLSDYVYLNGKLILKVMNDAFVPPDGPTNLKASMVAPDAVNLSWKDNSTNEIKFRIERKTGGDGSYAEIGAVNANITTYSDPGLNPGGTYLYKVRASNAGGDSGYSNEAQVTLRTFTISATAGPNGNIVPQGNISVYYGADQTFTITPDTGYHVSGVSIDGPDMGVLSTYTFNNVTSDHAIHATFEINPPKISVSPSSHNFGNIYLGTTPMAQSFILSNTGTVGLVIGSITPTGTNANEFSKTMDGCSGGTIAASESCIVQVVFSPTSAGEKSADLTIPSNDPLTPTFNGPLSGTVVEGRSLTVIKSGNGTGMVTSSSPGINCGDDCSELYIKGTVVTLTATTPSDSIFTGWTGGGCSGTGNCVITMNNDTTVTAGFNGKYSISGRVITSARTSLEGVTISASGANTGTATTDNSGKYTVTGLTNGTYTLVPSKTGYSFTPANRAVTIKGANVIRQDFTAPTYSISGKVLKANGASFAGVTVTLSGVMTKTATTNILGNYSFTGLINGVYAVTPNKAGFTFTPESRAIPIEDANVTAQNFKALP